MNNNGQAETNGNDYYYNYLVNKLDDIKIENERVLGRNTLIISGGAFTLSVTLLKEIYTNPLPWTKWFLILSWVVFGICAFLQIYSNHLSSLAVDVQRKNMDDYYRNNIEEARNRPNKYDQWVRRINGCIPWILCVGFLFMIVFCTTNFLNAEASNMKKPTPDHTVKKENPESDLAKRGVTMPPIPPKQKPPPFQKPKNK